jgi:hypothetical protein
VLEAKPKNKNRRPVSGRAKTRKWPLYALFVAAAGLLVAGGVAIRQARPTAMTERQQLINIGHAVVRQTIQEGLRVAFAGEEETIVESLPDHKFMISGWVDLITPQGRPQRRSFSCIIYKNDNETWVGEHVSVIPQM